MSGRRTYFLDTNVLLRFLLKDNKEQSPIATEFFARFADGEFDLIIADSVIFESVFVMQGNNYRVDRPAIADRLSVFMSQEGIQVVGVVDFPRVFDLYVSIPQLSFADCAHAVLTMETPGRTIVSFDREYPRVEEITWLVPDQVPVQ